MSIIGCHNCSYSAILIVFCTFKFSSMTLSLSLLHVNWILCYRIKNISFMVFIKQMKPRIFVQCDCCYTDWINTARLPMCMRVCGKSTARLSGGLLTIDFGHKHSIGRILGLW